MGIYFNGFELINKLDIYFIGKINSKLFENNLEPAHFFIDNSNIIWAIQNSILEINYSYEILSGIFSDMKYKIIKPINDKYIHKKTNGNYKLLYFGKSLIDNKIIDIVLYLSEYNNNIWVRPKEQFFDGRFILIEKK